MTDQFDMPEVLTRDDAGGAASEAPSRKAPRRRRWATLLPWGLTAALLVTVLAVWLARREPLEELTPASLAAARQRWLQADVDSYHLELEVVPPGLKSPNQIVLEVRGGRVTAMTVNGQPSGSDPRAYTVDGLFDVLSEELAVSADEANAFGSTSGRNFLRVRFDPQYGFTPRYLRVVGGTNRSSELRVTGFEVTGNDTDPTLNSRSEAGVGELERPARETAGGGAGRYARRSRIISTAISAVVSAAPAVPSDWMTASRSARTCCRRAGLSSRSRASAAMGAVEV